MGKTGRFGKYGENKRFERLRQGRAPLARAKSAASSCRRHRFKKSLKHRPELGIRTATPSDRSFIANLSREVFSIYGAYEETVSEWFQSGLAVTVIAQMDGRVAGFAMVGYSVDELSLLCFSELLAIAVEPQWQGRGIGVSLLREIEAIALELNVFRLFLHTATDNVEARKLFDKCGYLPAETKKSFYPKGQDALVMFKDLR